MNPRLALAAVLMTLIIAACTSYKTNQATERLCLNKAAGNPDAIRECRK